MFLVTLQHVNQSIDHVVQVNRGLCLLLLFQAFMKIGHSTQGLLKKHDLRQLLLQFVMPVSDEEFSKLWKR